MTGGEAAPHPHRGAGADAFGVQTFHRRGSTGGGGGVPTPNPWLSPLGRGAEQGGGVTAGVPRPTAPAPHLLGQRGGGGVWPLSAPKRGLRAG